VLVPGLGALVLIAAALAANFLLGRRDTGGPVVRASLNLPPDVTLLTLGDQGGAPAIAHDGSNLVFAGIMEGKQMLFLRSMEGATVKALPGTEGGKFPFWSPDGKSIGFFSDQQLKRLDIAGGPPRAWRQQQMREEGRGPEIPFFSLLIFMRRSIAFQLRVATPPQSQRWIDPSTARTAGLTSSQTENIFSIWRRTT